MRRQCQTRCRICLCRGRCSLPCSPQLVNIISACRPQDNKEAQQKFQEISTAYDTLRDPQKRSMYDRVGPEGVEEGGGMGGFGVSFVCSGQPT